MKEASEILGIEMAELESLADRSQDLGLSTK